MQKNYLKKFLLFAGSIFFVFIQNTVAQINTPAATSLNKISTINKNWQQGGIFNGEYPEKEILVARTEYTKKFDKGNGIINMIFGGPFHYPDYRGGWQDINLIIKNQDNGVYAYLNEENKFISRFAQKSYDGVKMEYKNTGLEFGINTSLTANNWMPVASNNSYVLANENSITYKNIYENIDLEYEITTEAIQHRMIFINKNVFNGLMQQQFIRLEETINLPLNAVLKDQDGIISINRITKGNIFIVVNEDTIFTIFSAHIWDATFKGNILEKGDEFINGVSDIKTSVLFLQGNGIKLIASIPTNWLLAPERVYPITFDPTVNIGNAGSFNSSYRYPFNTCRQQRISQILFLKSDINTGGINTTGNITQVDFFQNTNNPISNNNVRVKMQEVTWNEMTTSTLTSTGFTDCNVPAIQNFTSGGSYNWRPLMLGNQFPFTNTRNLLIEVSFNNAPNNTTGCTCTNTGPGGYWGWYNSPYAGHRWAYSNNAATPPSGADCNYSNSPEGNPAYGYYIPATRITLNTATGCSPISISSHPSSQSIVAPSPAQFTVSVSGTTPTYQWKRSTDGGATWGNAPAVAPYSGSTSNQLTINPTSAVMNGYRFRCEVTNSCTTPTPAISNIAVLTINAAGCATVLTPISSPSIPAAGGTGSFGINVTPNTCSWSATETLTWVTITSPLSGTGDATLNYTVAANTGTARSGIITVNGQNHTVNQLGAAAPTTYIISGRVIENGSPGLPGVTIATSPAIGNAITNAQGYYSITVPLSYTGTVTPTLAPFNFTPASRSVSSTNYSNKDFDAEAVSIVITNSVIPPWQREGDDYNGSITVQIGNTNTNSWHLEADVYNGSTWVGNVRFPSTISTTYNFSTQTGIGLQLKALSVNGRTVKYAAVFDANTTIQAYPGISTNIIESKWDKKNVVYHNTTTNQLRIPIKWSSNVPIKIKFSIINNTARQSVGLTAALPILNSNGTDFIYFISNGYFILDALNSNIKHAFPADYKYEMFDAISNIPLEDGIFDLTKIGKINNGQNSDKILVMIGGIFNEMESSATDLIVNSFVYPPTNPLNPENINSPLSYSPIEYCRKNCSSGFATWYIGQGNGNYIIRNGYDLGIALQEISRLNPSVTDINLLCHSKGGLDIRALLASYNVPMKGTPRFNFPDSLISQKIKKVIFFDSPHKGAQFANLVTYIPSSILNNTPGTIDLMQSNNGTIATLNTKPMPSNIHFLNITGYREFENSITNMSDQVVKVLESENPSLYTPLFSQAYQQDARKDCSPNSYCNSFPHGTLDFFHMMVHKNVFLNYRGSQNYQTANCTDTKSNLIKVKEFLDAPFPYVGDYNCSSTWFHYYVSIFGSKISGTNVFIKTQDNIYKLNPTEEYGNIFFNTRLKLNNLDSLLVMPNGYDPIRIPVTTSKSVIALFKSNSTNVINPSLSLINQYPITNLPWAQIKVTAQNASHYLINQHSSDNIFIPLNLVNNIATIPLDTGYNKIIVKFIGIDTISLIKSICYLPNSLMNDLTFDFTINTPQQFGKTKIYVDDQFYWNINTSSTNLKLMNGISELKFTQFGYRDTSFIINMGNSINLVMVPHSYSSFTDSIFLDFNNRLNPQYWKTITVKSLSANTNKQLSVMQYDDSYIGMSLKPQTRKFVFRKLGSAAPASFKTAIALDQITTPDKDSVYLLYKNGKDWVKYQANQNGVSEYDSEVQKIAFDKLYIDDFETRELVLMQKQAPIMKNLDTIWHSGQTIAFPLSIFVGDPDSIKNDLGIFSNDVKVSVIGKIVYITAPVNFTGTTTYTLSGTHDFLDVSKSYIMKVIPPEVYIPNAFTPNRDGLNDVIRPIFMGKLISCHFAIFNRNGQKVYETTDCAGGWDGRIRGAVQDPGTYVWMLSYQFEGEQKKETKGTVVLIK